MEIDNRIRVFHNAPSNDWCDLLLFGPMEMNVAALHACFQTLSREETSIALHEQAFIKPLNAVEVVLASVSNESNRQRPNARYEELLVETMSPPRLIWTMPTDDWDNAACFLEPFMNEDERRASHQWLGIEQSVLISMGEYEEGRFVEP